MRFEVKTSHGLGVYAHLGAFMRRTVDDVISLCPPYQNPPPITQALRKDERSELKAWVEVDFDKDLDFEGSTRLGSGGFGEVRTARWNGSDVAVKHLLVHTLHDDTVRALRKEIRVHSSLHFDHVVQLYAASTVPPHLCLVIELASGGSLWEYLHSTREPLPHARQAAFLYDIARGMLFLHTKGILHRDLKSSNVLVFDNGRLKLCDFGLSKVKTEVSSRSKRGPVGTAQWMSPEEMDESPANELTDVYRLVQNECGPPCSMVVVLGGWFVTFTYACKSTCELSSIV